MKTANGAADAPFLPLRLAEEHLDELGTLWLFRRGLVFSMRALPEALARTDARMDSHMAALALERDRAVREAELRLHSVVGWQRFGAVRALLELSPGSVRGPDARLRIRGTRDFALLDALRHGPPGVARWLDGVQDVSALAPAVLDAASFFGPVRGELLDAALAAEPPLRRAALLAGARHPETAGRVVRAATEALSVDDPETRLLGAYALGLADPPRFAERAETALGGDPLDAGLDPLVLGLFGGPAAVVALLRAARDALLPDDPVAALGLAGDPAAIPLLVELCEHADGAGTRAAAVHALRCITGQLCARPKPSGFDLELLDDIKQARESPSALAALISKRAAAARSPSLPEGKLEVDLAAARALLTSTSLVPGRRYHLGVPLGSETEVPALPLSFAWLRAAAVPEARASRESQALACEVPDMLVPGEGYGALSMGPDHLFAARKASA